MSAPRKATRRASGAGLKQAINDRFFDGTSYLSKIGGILCSKPE